MYVLVAGSADGHKEPWLEPAQALSAAEFVNLCQNAGGQAERGTIRPKRGLLGMLHQMGRRCRPRPDARDQVARRAYPCWAYPARSNWFTGTAFALLDYGTAEYDRGDLGERLHRDSEKALLYPDPRLDYIIDLLQQPPFALALSIA